MAKRDLAWYLREVRRLEERRTAEVQRELRTEYKRALKDMRGYIAQHYAQLPDGLPETEVWARQAQNARLMEEVMWRAQRMHGHTSPLLKKMVEDAYTISYEGAVGAVRKAAGDMTVLGRLLQPVSRVNARVLDKAVNNPIAGLTLSETLQRRREDVVWNIKRALTTGAINGDRYESVARRITDVVNGDYVKAHRIARTEAHRVNEAGRYDGMNEVEKRLKAGGADFGLFSTWMTMGDERVRPNRGRGKKPARGSKANHVQMDGVMVPFGEEFDLGVGVKTKAPGNSGDAGNDINCRCTLETTMRDRETLQEVGADRVHLQGESGILNRQERGAPAAGEFGGAPLETSGPWSGVDGFSEKANAKLYEAERASLKRTTEEATVIGADGKVLLQKSGDRNSVRFTDDEIRRMKGHVLTHNHSGIPLPPSPQDMNMLRNGQLQEIRAATDAGVFRVKQPTIWDNRIDEFSKLKAEYDKIDEAVMKKYPLDRTKHNFAVWDAEIQRETVKRFVKKFKIDYLIEGWE